MVHEEQNTTGTLSRQHAEERLVRSIANVNLLHNSQLHPNQSQITHKPRPNKH